MDPTNRNLCLKRKQTIYFFCKNSHKNKLYKQDRGCIAVQRGKTERGPKKKEGGGGNVLVVVGKRHRKEKREKTWWAFNHVKAQGKRKERREKLEFIMLIVICI